MGSGGVSRIGRIVAMKSQDRGCWGLLSSTLYRKVTLVLVVPVEIPAPDVGPEYFENLREGVGGHLRIEALEVIAQPTFPRVVGVSDRRSDGVPTHFGEVERPAAVVIARNEQIGRASCRERV